MVNRLVSALTGVSAAAFVAVIAAQGCGGGGGKSPQALCNESCDKAVMCSVTGTEGNPEEFRTFCKAICSSAMPNPNAGQRCTNESAIAAAYESCLKKPCDQYEACINAIPECQGGGSGGSAGGGTGGRTGSGGSPGTSGSGGASGGGADQWVCGEQAGTGCSCATGDASSGSCTGSYSCCFLVVDGTDKTCVCSSLITTAQCSAAAQAAGGSVVSRCPP